MRIFAAFIAMAWLAQPAFAQQDPSPGAEQPGGEESMTDCPTDDQSIGETPSAQQSEQEEIPQTPSEESPGEETPDENPEAVAVGNWLLDFPQRATPWQSDGTTFTSDTCTWSEVFPLLTDLSVIAGPIECTEGILPTFGLGVISGGEMSAIAVRFLFIFPLISSFEGHQITSDPMEVEGGVSAGEGDGDSELEGGTEQSSDQSELESEDETIQDSQADSFGSASIGLSQLQ